MSASVKKAAFVGFGQSRLFRHDEVALGTLAEEATRLAVADAGLKLSDIDGIACSPEQPFSIEGRAVDGIQFVTTEFVIESLELTVQWSNNVRGMLGTTAVDAIRAVESGQCETAVVFRALHSPSGSYGHTREEEATGPDQYTAPYGIFYPAGRCGQPWHRYQDKYKSGSREQMATLVRQARKHGLDYEGGYWAQRGASEITLEEYLSARFVSTPACVLDCDIPVQGAAAFVVTSADRAKDLPHPPAYVRAIGQSSLPPTRGVQTTPLESLLANARSIGQDIWRQTGLTPTEIGVADLYDGFSMLAIIWLEGIGFCEEGQAFEFIQDGRIAMDGLLPVNPSGGNLGAGRLHGCNHLMDGILQMMKRSGPRQVEDAEFGLVTIGPPSPFAPALLFSRSPS
jgi:acetyl-CoA acetyltransferase